MTTRNIDVPKYGAGIALAESMAPPIVAAERERLEREIPERSLAFPVHEQVTKRQLAQIQRELAELRSRTTGIGRLAQQRLDLGRAPIADDDDDAKGSGTQVQDHLAAARQISEIQKESAPFADQQRELELTVARQLDAEREEIGVRAIRNDQSHTRQDVEELSRTRLAAVQRESEARKTKAAKIEGVPMALRATHLAESRCGASFSLPAGFSRPSVATFNGAEVEFRENSATLANERREFELNAARQLNTLRERVREQAIRREQTRNEWMLRSNGNDLVEPRAKLAASQSVELNVCRPSEALEGEKQALEWGVVHLLDEERKPIVESGKEKMVDDNRKQTEEWRSECEQDSSFLRSPVQELQACLRKSFPMDQFTRVPTLNLGGDIVQKVIGQGGVVCGDIVWESKRAKKWRGVRPAELGPAVSATAPKVVDSSDRIDDVWVVDFDCVVPLATVLRIHLINSCSLRPASQQCTGKSDRVYAYVTGGIPTRAWDDTRMGTD